MREYRHPDVNGHAESFTTTAGNRLVVPGRSDRRASSGPPRLPPQDRTRQAFQALAQSQMWGERLSATYDPTVASWGYQGRHPVLQITERLPGHGMDHATQLLVFHAMRAYSPTLDAAIRNRRTLEGDAMIESEDEGLREALTEWMQDVPVGFMAGQATLRGLDTYVNMLADAADEYGLSAGEIRTEEQGRDITRLVVPNVRTLSRRQLPGSDLYGVWHTSQTQGSRRIDESALVQFLAFGHSAEDPWPPPLCWSAVQSTEAVLRMFESVVNAWWRSGDPSMLLGIEYDAEVTPDTTATTSSTGEVTESGTTYQTENVEVPKELLLMMNTISGIMEARKRGDVGDAFVATQGGKIINEVLGEVDSSMSKYFREHASVFDGHVVALSRTPVWMYPSLSQQGDGLGSARSNQQAAVCAADAHKRNRLKARLYRSVLDTLLVLRGESRFVGRYDVAFDMVSPLDEQLLAETAETEARTDAQRIENAVQLYDESGERRFQGEAEDYLTDHGLYD